MYRCKKCQNESEFPSSCCGREMKCEICHGAGCTICEEDKDFE